MSLAGMQGSQERKLILIEQRTALAARFCLRRLCRYEVLTHTLGGRRGRRRQSGRRRRPQGFADRRRDRRQGAACAGVPVRLGTCTKHCQHRMRIQVLPEVLHHIRRQAQARNKQQDTRHRMFCQLRVGHVQD